MCACACILGCQVNEAAEEIHRLVHSNANLIFGACIDPSMDDEVSREAALESSA